MQDGDGVKRRTCDENFVKHRWPADGGTHGRRCNTTTAQKPGRADEPTQNSRMYTFHDLDYESVPRYNVSQLPDKKPEDSRF